MEFRGTTICAVKRNGVTAIAGDGQVTLGESVIFKNSAVKVRRIYGGKVILGFAGSVTDAFSLTERFEGMLNKFAGNLMRSAVELAELWRSDKVGRKLDAMMITAETVGEATEKTTPDLPSAAEKEREKAEKPAKKTCPKRAARSAKEEE